MKDWYGVTLKLGDYVKYGRPNSKIYVHRLCRLVAVKKNGLIGLAWGADSLYYTSPHNVVKLKSEEVVIGKLKGKITEFERFRYWVGHDTKIWI